MRNDTIYSSKDRNNNTTGYSYTPTGNIDTVTFPDSSTVKFTYDLDDKLTQMTDSLGLSSYGYDDAKRLTSYTNPFNAKVSYTYDAAANIKSLTYPDGKVVTYTYDNLNRIKTVTKWLNQTATYNYDNAGRLMSFVNFNGTITSYTYDSANRLTSLSTSKSDTTPLLNYAFTLDSNGNRREILQLEPLSPTVSLGTTSYVYNNANNRLTSFNGLTLSYDNEGQTTTGTAGAYGYDYDHRLVSAPGITYSYDGRGNRLKAVRYGAETHYVYDASGNLLAQTDNAGNIIQYYIYGAGLLAMVDNAGNIYCYHFNATGNTIALTDSTETIVNKYTYTPFGVVTEQQTVSQPFKYVGQYGVMQEPNGLYYMRARYYDPTLGRFISEDPSGFAGGQVNLYEYVADNPLSLIDPYGLAYQVGVAAGAGIMVPGVGAALSVTLGLNIDGWNSSIFLQGQASGGFGGGFYAGASIGPVVSHGSSPTTGIASTPYNEGDVGVGDYSVSVGATTNAAGNIDGESGSAGKGGLGFAIGAGVMTGQSYTATVSSSTVSDAFDSK